MSLESATAFFDANYRGGGTSGEGSTIDVTISYRHMLEDFIRLNNVQTVLDVGCGDWRFSRRIPWADYGVTYLGVDVSPFIVEQNTNDYGNDRCQFRLVRTPSDILDFGRFDLIISKDALQHMPNDVICEYLDVFEKCGRHCLLTNDVFPSYQQNEDIEPGGWRTLDLRKAPFSRDTTIIAEYINYFGEDVPGYARRDVTFFVKHVHLLKSPALHT